MVRGVFRNSISGNPLHGRNFFLKASLKVFGVLVVLGIGFVMMVSLFLNSIVRNGLEIIGPEITGTTVTLESVELSPLSGVGHLEQLIVGNPQGYETPYSFKLGIVHVQAEMPSMLSETLTTREIVIDGPEISFEGTLIGNNLSDIQENVEAFAKKAGAAEEEANAEVSEGESQKIVIEDFILRNAQVHLSTPLLKGKDVAISLPEIHMRDIGKRSQGLTYSELTPRVVSEITSEILRAIADSGRVFGKGIKKIQETGLKIMEGVKGLFD